MATNPPDMGVSGPSTDALIPAGRCGGLRVSVCVCLCTWRQKVCKGTMTEKADRAVYAALHADSGGGNGRGVLLHCQKLRGRQVYGGVCGVLCGVIVVSVFAAGAMTVQWLGTLIDARESAAACRC
ncbi:MAG: hypothetical protein ACLSB9_21465 [Hydrogeniiclostridium mannosilyticum]